MCVCVCVQFYPVHVTGYLWLTSNRPYRSEHHHCSHRVLATPWSAQEGARLLHGINIIYIVFQLAQPHRCLPHSISFLQYEVSSVGAYPSSGAGHTSTGVHSRTVWNALHPSGTHMPSSYLAILYPPHR